MSEKQQHVAFKIVLIGDTNVGKSTICRRYVKSYIATSQNDEGVVKNYNVTIKADKYILNLGIWDTTARKQYKKLRRLAYANADAFIILFSINDRQSFRNAIQKWLQEATDSCPEASVIFVGNKSDLRYSLNQNSSDNQDLIDIDEIEERISDLKNYRYVECSALSLDNLQKVFLECAKQIIEDEKNQKKYHRKRKLLQNCNQCQLI